MSDRDVRKCPVPGCHRQHSRRLLMCPDHWSDVPRRLRQEVYATHSTKGIFSDEYQQAAAAAIASVSQ